MKNYNMFAKLKAVLTFTLVFTTLIISVNYKNCKAQDLQDIRVRIIESRDGSHIHHMDKVWDSVVVDMGFNSLIVPYTFLDDTNNIQNTEILIVSAGCISISAGRVETIKRFLTNGKNVYLQAEYSLLMSSNGAFLSIVNQLGGSFLWSMTVSGDLQPMNILGTLSQIPNYVPSISYFWYGCAGSGDSYIENFMEYQGNYFGFVFTPPNENFGKMITTSDQDWVGHIISKPLMQNILYRLANTLVAVKNNKIESPANYKLHQNYPNPFNPTTSIKFDIPKSSFVKLFIYNVLGKEIATLVNNKLNTGSYEADWSGYGYPSSVYYYRLTTNEFSDVKKMILIR